MEYSSSHYRLVFSSLLGTLFCLKDLKRKKMQDDWQGILLTLYVILILSWKIKKCRLNVHGVNGYKKLRVSVPVPQSLLNK